MSGGGVLEGTQESVSVLFSEPKIPQSKPSRWSTYGSVGFSALQRAENSSIDLGDVLFQRDCAFQCSSASRKFLNHPRYRDARAVEVVSVLFSEPKIPQSKRSYRSAPAAVCFSALQRAENSSILAAMVRMNRLFTFQCSSASRKFLNSTGIRRCTARIFSFSALQRAENSSIPRTKSLLSC